MHSPPPTQSIPATNPRISNLTFCVTPAPTRFVASGRFPVNRKTWRQERRFARKALLFLATAPEAQEEKFWKRKAASARKFLKRGIFFSYKTSQGSNNANVYVMVILRDFRFLIVHCGLVVWWSLYYQLTLIDPQPTGSTLVAYWHPWKRFVCQKFGVMVVQAGCSKFGNLVDYFWDQIYLGQSPGFYRNSGRCCLAGCTVVNFGTLGSRSRHPAGCTFGWWRPSRRCTTGGEDTSPGVIMWVDRWCLFLPFQNVPGEIDASQGLTWGA